MEEITTIISTLGFPIFVAIWMLFKGSKDSELLKESVNDLKVAIVELTAMISKGGKDE